MQVVTTISRGRLVWHNGKLDVQPRTGRFVKMPLYGALHFGLGVQDAQRLQPPVAAKKRSQPGSGTHDEL